MNADRVCSAASDEPCLGCAASPWSSRAKRKFPQASFALLCFRMRRAKDPPRPRHEVLVHRDGLAQGVFAAEPCDGVGDGLAKYERDIVVISKRAPSVCQRLTYYSLASANFACLWRVIPRLLALMSVFSVQGPSIDLDSL